MIFGLCIEAGPSGVGKNNFFCPYWIYTKTFIWNATYIKVPAGQRFESGTTKATSVPNNKNVAAEVAPHMSSALRDLSVIFINLFYLLVPNWWIQTLQVL